MSDDLIPKQLSGIDLSSFGSQKDKLQHMVEYVEADKYLK